MLFAAPSETVPIHLLATDANGALFPEVKVYDPAGAFVANIYPTHIANGYYHTTYVAPATEGIYALVGRFWSDAGYTVDAGYEQQGEVLDVGSIKSNTMRILGLLHENAHIYNQTYDGDDNLTGANIRVYDSKANAILAGMGGLRYEYTIQASYTAGLLTSYKILRDS
jgi:YD repeat-containing protein